MTGEMIIRTPKPQIDLTGARQHLAEVLASRSEDIIGSWVQLAGDEQVARIPQLSGYLRSLTAGLQEIVGRDDWTVAQAVVDALADRRARTKDARDQGLQRALLACRTAVRPYLDPDLREPCDELLLDVLHECLFRFFESFQGVQLVTENERLHGRVIKSLVMALEARDPYTKGHSMSVALMCQKVSEQMNGAVEPSRAYLAGLLHDVGKVGVPDRILLKQERLTDSEWRLMHAHPRMGASILTPIRLYPDVVGAVLSHHENHDGSGYPYGLAEDEIPQIAQVIRVVDSFDAMTSSRAYRPSRSVAAAVEEIQALSGTFYHPDVVEAFVRVIDQPEVVHELGMASLQIDLGDFALNV
jgi:putative nucleotidyltransferase with HDIG domain